MIHYYYELTQLYYAAALWDWCYPDYWMGDGFTVDGAEQKWTMVSVPTFNESVG